MKITNQSTLTSKITLPDSSEEDITTQSNESNTENMTESFLKVKSSNKTFAKTGEEVEFTITLTNNSEYPISNVNIIDSLSEGATFQAGSVTIDETSYEDYDPTVGFSLTEEILPEAEVNIKYNVKIDDETQVTEITNTASITYSVNEISDLQEDTNSLSVQVVNNIITLTKTSDKSAVIKGQTLTYQIVIKNEGNMTNTNLVFTDPLPDTITFVEGSVKVNDEEVPDANPNDGFSLNDLEPQGEIKVTFDVTVN